MAALYPIGRPGSYTTSGDTIGDGTDHLHHGGGYRYLVVNSECDWTVEVISL